MENNAYPIEIEILHTIEDMHDDNVDVHVVLSNGERYSATFFTLKNVERLMRSYQESGECLNGSFFWARDMIIVTMITPEEVSRVVWDLVSSGELKGAMSLIRKNP
ncbi:hypothetical protein [Lysobacter silvisoli]|uniref:hypothetical protein n=1 Tax=Lysobacter silvisoli TaxID=2293254 RepID=UPI0011C05977|nr:hypothetical protein [Lysobacter silvisoli]